MSTGSQSDPASLAGFSLEGSQRGASPTRAGEVHHSTGMIHFYSLKHGSQGVFRVLPQFDIGGES
jgi:hypothetical protein